MIARGPRASIYAEGSQGGIGYSNCRCNYVRKGYTIMFELNLMLETRGKSNKQEGSSTSALSIFTKNLVAIVSDRIV